MTPLHCHTVRVCSSESAQHVEQAGVRPSMKMHSGLSKLLWMPTTTARLPERAANFYTTMRQTRSYECYGQSESRSMSVQM